MHICLVGWYGHQDLYELLGSCGFPVTVISHKKDNDYLGLPTINIPNLGLEFGCYDYFIHNVWPRRKGNVLFMHDDMVVEDKNVFKRISKLEHDCAYIFRDYAEHRANGGKHGRAVFCSQRFIEVIMNTTCRCHWCEEKFDAGHNPEGLLPELFMGAHRGFWYDYNNNGHVSGKPPVGIRHYNSAIDHFHWVLGRIRDQRYGEKDCWPNPKEKLDVVNRVYFSDMVAGRRNCWKHIDRELGRYSKELPSEQLTEGIVKSSARKVKEIMRRKNG